VFYRVNTVVSSEGEVSTSSTARRVTESPVSEDTKAEVGADLSRQEWRGLMSAATDKKAALTAR